MKTQHTPGPWDINQEERTVSKYRIYTSTKGEDAGKNIGWFDPDAETQQQEIANARLIAAAPELLEALQLIAKRSRALLQRDAEGMIEAFEKEIKNLTGATIETAETAIRKATEAN